MLQADTTKRWIRQFDNLPELVQWIRSTPRLWSQEASKSRTRSNGWDLNAGYDGALKLAETGWEEGVQSLFALAATVPNNTITTREYGVAGEHPDVPRYLAGDPYNMVHRGRQRAPKPSMTIALNTRISYAVSAKEAANFGAAVVALVDRLESRGVRVELVGLCATDGSKRFCVSWGIKRTEDMLDLSAVAFSYAHPAMFRRIIFAAMERSPRDIEHFAYGVGGGIKEEDFVDIAPGALLINGVDHNPGACKTMEGALKFATGEINRAYKAAGFGDALAELEAYE